MPTIISNNKHINHNFMQKKTFYCCSKLKRKYSYQHNTYLCNFMDPHPVGCLTNLAHCFLDIPIVCMIPTNNLQELLKSPLPCGHSPSRPRLRHPLLCYTVPRVIHLSLPRISRTRRVSETSSSLTVEVSL
jgi:hypothetical protein